jgi:hypothetical protein
MTLRQRAAFPVGNLSAVTESNAFLSQNIYVVNNMKRYSQVLTAQYIYMCFLPKKCYRSDMSLLLFILGIIIGGILIFKFTNRCSNCGSYGTRTKSRDGLGNNSYYCLHCFKRW